MCHVRSHALHAAKSIINWCCAIQHGMHSIVNEFDKKNNTMSFLCACIIITIQD